MEASVQIPVPAASDVESVVTALEMAALFGAKGEGNEAVRWLKRAAESAGAEGHDERALALARTAADLDDQLRSAPNFGRTPSERPLPAESPASSAPNGGASAVEALPIPLGRRSGFPKPPSRPSSTSSLSPAPSTPPTRLEIPEGGRPPPAPSQRTQPPPKPRLSQRSHSIASAAARSDAGSSTPSAPRVGAASRHPQAGASRPSALPSAPRPSSLTPAPSSVRATSSAKASSSIKPEPKPDSTEATVRATNGNGTHAVTNGAAAPEANGASKSADPQRPIKFAKGSVCSRQTARVSVQASTEPGVYVMRVLDDDETTLPGRAVEGLLVLVDPDAKLPTEDSN
jgi:hypothetical protein